MSKLAHNSVFTRPNKALQTGKVKLARLLRTQKPGQFAFAAKLRR